MEIDPRMQQAAVSNLEAQRTSRQADVQYARQQATRMRTLLDAGAASAAELEQAETALSTSEAQLKAVEAQIREAARHPRLLPGDRAHRGGSWATSRCASATA
jgi:macrolide-specific efflux system membrane fusion protein